jgi:predicted DNA-binding transcriptional regulator YafY
MAKKRRAPTPIPLRAVTAERAARVYRLLQILSTNPETRSTLIKRLNLDIRGFYRDLELLRAARIDVTLQGRRYRLEDDLEKALPRLPFPDPGLTLGEALQLAKGRTQAHRKLKAQIVRIVG